MRAPLASAHSGGWRPARSAPVANPALLSTLSTGGRVDAAVARRAPPPLAFRNMKNPEPTPPPFIDWGAAPKEGPLERFKGERPAAPKWFDDALAQQPERSFTPVQGAQIETLAWGERGKPGLLLMHGNGAHADWWSFIAPFFADRYRVAALSWSGMGNSEWRKEYRVETFADEALAVAQVTGLFDASAKPIFVAHSFGALMLRFLAMEHGERIAGALVVDSRTDMMGRNARDNEEAERRPPPRKNANRIYATLPEALARFRLAPPQACENHFAVDYIARHALRQVEGPDGQGWQWKFDPFLFGNMAGREMMDFERPARCPMAMMWGERSLLMDARRLKAMRNMEEGGGPMVEIPDAGHHVWLDQPIAFVSALAALLEAWPARR